MENYSISNACCQILDFKASLAPATSNESGFLIQSNCDRTEYPREPSCARLTVEGVQRNLIRLVALLLQRTAT